MDVVIINRSKLQRDVQLHLKNAKDKWLKIYETSKLNSLLPVKAVAGEGRFTIPERSISTVVIAH